jgi:uncharacterized protein (TIGR02996 family)
MAADDSSSMSHADGFLSDIRAHPDDDAPRLIYADWLDEQGQLERAEFIRVQCRLAALDPRAPERPFLKGRQLQLLRRHRKEWAGPLRRWAKEWHFHRGFVEHIRLPASVFLEHAAELFACAPIRMVHFVGLADRDEELARCPYFQQLTGVGMTDPRFTVGQAQSCRPRRYQGGEFANPLAAIVLETLLSRLSGQRLHTLELAGCFLGTAGIRVLAQHDELAGLRCLDLCNNDLTGDDIHLLAEAPGLGPLRQFRLQSCYNHSNSDSGSLIGAVTRLLPRLELLDLGSCALSTEDLVRLDRASARCLKALVLERNLLAPEGTELLSRALYLARLDTLNLSSCLLSGEEIRPSGLHELLTNSAVARLTHLSLGNNPLGEAGARMLATSTALEHLTHLELAGSSYREWDEQSQRFVPGRPQEVIGDAGVRALAGATHLVRLSALDLRRNALSCQGLRALLESPLLPQLWWLDLRDNPLGSEGAGLLIRHGPWPRLAWLDVCNTGLDAAARSRLRAQFGAAVRL